METWCDEVAVQIAVVGTDSCHHDELVVEIIGVLSINARYGFLLIVACLGLSLVVGETVLLTQVVVVEAHTC